MRKLTAQKPTLYPCQSRHNSPARDTRQFAESCRRFPRRKKPGSLPPGKMGGMVGLLWEDTTAIIEVVAGRHSRREVASRWEPLPRFFFAHNDRPAFFRKGSG